MLLPGNRCALQQFEPASGSLLLHSRYRHIPGLPSARTPRIFLDIPACSLEKHRAAGKTLCSWSNGAICQQDIDLPRLQRRHREAHPAAFPDLDGIGYRQVVHRNTR